MAERKGGVGTDIERTRRILEAMPPMVVRVNGETVYAGKDLRGYYDAIGALLPDWNAGNIDAAWGDLGVHTMHPIK